MPKTVPGSKSGIVDEPFFNSTNAPSSGAFSFVARERLETSGPV